jgi:hypothetical protein
LILPFWTPSACYTFWRIENREQRVEIGYER